MLFALTRFFLNESRSRGRKSVVASRESGWWWMNESNSAFAKECSDERREYTKIISAFARIVCNNKTSPLPYVHVVYSQKVFTIITHFPSFTSSWRAIGTKTSWLCLCWRTAALGFSRRRESRRWLRACTRQLWKISVAEWSHWWKYSALGYAAFIFHSTLHETPHTSKCFQGFLRAFKSDQQIGTVKSLASECIWCEWWPVDSNKLNEFVLALRRVTNQRAMCVRCPREPVKSVEMCGDEKILFQMKLITCDPIWMTLDANRVRNGSQTAIITH